MIGIIGAMRVEIEKFLELMENIESVNYADLTFYAGKYKKLDIVVLQSGIGMVNASIGATILINNFKVDKIIFSGIAGSTNENVRLNDIVVGSSFVEYGFDVTAFGYELGQRAGSSARDIKACDNMIKLIEDMKLENNIHYGLIASSDVFVNTYEKKKDIKDKFNAIAVDMESAAVAHVCEKFNIDYLIVRSISDSMIDNSSMEYEIYEKLQHKIQKILY